MYTTTQQKQNKDQQSENTTPEEAGTSNTTSIPENRAPRQQQSKQAEDNQPVGNTMGPIPDDGSILRIFAINNHIKVEKSGLDTAQGMEQLHQRQVGVFGYCETNANWQLGVVKENFKEAVSRIWDSSRIQSSTSNWKCNSICKHGGTVTVATGRWTGRVFVSGKDPWGMGRFSYIGLRGRKQRTIIVITIYRVGRQTIKTAGPKTVFHQEWQILRESGTDEPDPRERLVDDMIAFVRSNQAEGHEIIVMGDINENVRNLHPRKGMGRLLRTCQLQDVHQQHPHTATHANGNDPIDCILGSPLIADCVRRSGYTAFYETHSSDHRGLFVDVDVGTFFESNNWDATRLELRLLRSNNPKSVKRYLDHLKANLRDMPLQFQAILLHAPTREVAKKYFDELDSKLGAIMREAECKCGAKGKHESEWSTQLKAAILLVQYWKAKKRNLRKQHLRQAKLQRIRDKIEQIEPVDDNGSTSKEYIAKQLNSAKRILKAARRDDAQNREKFLAEAIKAAKADGNRGKAKRLAKQANAERQKRSHARIRRALQTKQRGGVTSLKVTEETEDGVETVIDIMDPLEIQERLLDRNRQHFQQAHETPFFDPRIINMVNDSADNEVSEAILNGDPVEVQLEEFPEVADFIRKMARPDDIQADLTRISEDISTDDVYYGFRKWRETTSTSPSGRHLGHYKSWIQDDELLEMLTNMLRIVAKFGFAPKRWCQSLNVMLEKEAGNPMITKLRTIHLYEADFNWMLKQFWAKRMLQYGEDQEVLGEEQHGSRRSRMAIDAVMLKLVSYDLSRALKKDMVSMDNDAKSCYDRIVIPLAMLASRRLGVPKTVARAHAETLRNMLHRIRTSHGVSEAAYSALIDELCGIGQGSGAGPALWVAISIVLIACYKDKADGMEFLDPTGTLEIERWLDGFVDDTEIGMNNFWEPNENIASLVASFQTAVQRWERLLFTSGGALELSKCLWYCMHWQWDAHGRAFVTNFGESGPSLRLTRGTNLEHTQTIRRLEVHEAHKTLGVRVDPLGLFDDEFEHLLHKANAHASRLAGSSLGSYDALTFFRSSFMSSVGYSFPVVPLSFDACRRIQGKMISTVLNKISYNRHFPRAVAYGPIALGGLDLPTIYVEQGIAKISTFLRHASSDSELGKIFLIILRVQQLEAGVSGQLLEHARLPIPYLTPSWITALRDFMGTHDIQIRLCERTQWKSYALNCPGDEFIMDAILRLKKYQQKELEDINRVRIYFKALTLSDVTNALGTAIDQKYWGTTRPSNQWEMSSWLWPIQPCITEAQARLWREAISLTFLDRFDKLKRKLGKWQRLTHRRPEYYVAPLENKLLVREMREETVPFFRIHEAMDDSDGDTFHLTVATTVLGDEVQKWILVPADVVATTIHLQARHRGFDLQLFLGQEYNTFQELVDLQSTPVRRLLAGLRYVHDDAVPLIRKHWDEESILLAATDGSAPGDGTFGWVVATEQGTHLVECCGPADGAPDQISSGRAESMGITSLGFFFKLLTRYFDRGPGGVCHNVTDSKAALRRAERASQSQRVLRSRMTSDMDCSTAYRNLGRDIYEYVDHAWVKGHQADRTPRHKLSLAARLNTRADELAEEYRQEFGGRKSAMSVPKAVPLPGQRVQLVVNGFAITQHHAHWIRYQINGYNHRSYLQQKHQWSNSQWDTIDWHGFKKAMLSQGPTDRRRTTKYLHGWWNTGTQRRRFNRNDFILCPRCMKCRETTDHVLYCSRQSADTQSYRKELNDRIHHITPRSLAEVFESVLRQLSREPEIRPKIKIKSTLPPEVRRHLNRAVAEQHGIGWNLMLRGYLAQSWTDAHAQLSGNGYDSNTTRSWSSRIIGALWKYAFRMWDLRCKLLNETDTALKYTKVDNAIRALYQEKANFLPQDQPLFYLPLTQALAQTASTKEARLVGLRAAHHRWLTRLNTDKVENSVRPTMMPKHG